MDLSDQEKSSTTIPQFGRLLPELVVALGAEVIVRSDLSDENDVVVRATDIYDSQATYPGGDGVLLCMISAQSLREEELDRAVAVAVENRCAGIVFKAKPDSQTPIIEKAQASGLSALVLADGVSWREFDALLTRLLGEDAPTLQLAPSTGDKLFALANTVARVFRGSVAIEDHQRSILSHSAVPGQAMDELRTRGILYRRAGDAPVNERRYREVLTAEGPVRFPSYKEAMPRVAIAMRAGAIPLGTIWVLDPEGENAEEPLPGEKLRLIEQSANLAAGYLLDAWRSENLSALPRDEAYKRLLAGAGLPGDAELIDSTGEALGILIVVLIPKRSQVSVRITEIRGVLSRHLAVYVPELLLTVIGQEIVALCPVESVELVRNWVIAALSELSFETRNDIRVGLSEPHTMRTALTYALAEARELATNAEAAEDSVATLARVRPTLFLAACRAVLDSDDRLVLPEVRNLLDDGERGQQYAETLDGWMQERGNVARTATRLRVHEQTVRYRLRRLQELAKIDHDDPDQLLTLWIQIRVLRTD